MDALIWPDFDDIGYEFRREAQLEMGVLYLVPPLPASPAATPPVRCRACRSRVARCFCPLLVAALAVAS
jgi:hypothetical protein